MTDAETDEYIYSGRPLLEAGDGDMRYGIAKEKWMESLTWSVWMLLALMLVKTAGEGLWLHVLLIFSYMLVSKRKTVVFGNTDRINYTTKYYTE